MIINDSLHPLFLLSYISSYKNMKKYRINKTGSHLTPKGSVDIAKLESNITTTNNSNPIWDPLQF